MPSFNPVFNALKSDCRTHCLALEDGAEKTEVSLGSKVRLSENKTEAKEDGKAFSCLGE